MLPCLIIPAALASFDSPAVIITVPIALSVLVGYGGWKGVRLIKRKRATGHWRHRPPLSPELQPGSDGSGEPPTLPIVHARPKGAAAAAASEGTAHWPPPQSEHDGHLSRSGGPSGGEVTGTEVDRARSFGLETAGLRETFDYTELTPALLGAVDEHLKHFEDSLSTVSGSEQEEAVTGREEQAPQLPPDEDDRASLQALQRRHTRASSVPSKTLKSALATSPPHSPPAAGNGSGGKKKKARFQDDPSGSDLSLRRTSTAPAEYGATASIPQWSGDTTAYFRGREERAGSEAERWEEGVDRDDDPPVSLVVEVQVEIDVDDRTSVDDDLGNGLLLAEAEDAEAETKGDGEGAGYDDTPEDPEGGYDADVEEAEARTIAAAGDDGGDADESGTDQAETRAQGAAVDDDRSMVEGELCVCEPDVEASSLATEDDEAGQTAGDDEDAGAEDDTVDAEEIDNASARAHHSCTDSSKCSSKDAGQDDDSAEIVRDTEDADEIDPAHHSCTDSSKCSSKDAGQDEDDTGAARDAKDVEEVDPAHHSCTDSSECSSKDASQDGDNAETSRDAETAEEVDPAHHSCTDSSEGSSKDDGQDEGPYLTPEDHTFEEIDQPVKASVHTPDDGPISMSADDQNLAEDAELNLIMPTIESSYAESPAQQEVLHRQNAPAALRRLSDSYAIARQDPSPDPVRRRASSMSDFQHLTGRLKLRPFAAKAAPADPAITASSVRVAESPRLNTVYEHPGTQYNSRPVVGKGPTKTAQTVSSGSSTYQMVWEEPPASKGSDSDTTLIEATEVPEETDGDSLAVHVDRSPSPMGKVKTKLAAWSWAREQQDDGEDSEGGSRGAIPLMCVDTDARRERSEDLPYAPPNTEKHSASSSARHSGPQTPREPEVLAEEDEVQQADDEAEVEADEEEDQPMELRFKSAFHRIRSLSMPASTDYLTLPRRMHGSKSPSSPDGIRAPSNLPRAISNLAAEEARFTSHRDSLDLNHHRIEREERMNQLLMTTRDSFVLAKTKYESKYPKAGIQYTRFGGLSPIPDASPPDAGKGMAALAKRVEGEKSAVEAGGKPDGHIHWAGQQRVEKAEKPKWYKAKYMKGEGGVLNLVLLDEEVSE
ncbi:hypothetical protein B0A55_02639 [Friedmanniomyces simplex]|uniref:Uncharacterized protein n=1 Tax=Friedmanniomyces simplex TaxID=329884 RepID=A0A4U0XHY1_9PEZI|nr:hypothetical protein B0A55_02639 [Friedmanniomyces simplex]